MKTQSLKKQSLRVLLLGACLAYVARPAQPILTSIVPNNATAGGPTFDITLHGTFTALPSQQATFGAVFTPPGGAPTTLTIIDSSATQIVATVPAALIAVAGNATVFATETVLGQPGVQDSASLAFTIVPPTPLISILNPPRLRSMAPASHYL